MWNCRGGALLICCIVPPHLTAWFPDCLNFTPRLVSVPKINSLLRKAARSAKTCNLVVWWKVNMWGIILVWPWRPGGFAAAAHAGKPRGERCSRRCCSTALELSVTKEIISSFSCHLPQIGTGAGRICPYKNNYLNIFKMNISSKSDYADEETASSSWKCYSLLCSSLYTRNTSS